MQKHLDLVQLMTQPKLEASNPWLIGGIFRTQLQNVLYNKEEFKDIDNEFTNFGRFCNDVLYQLSVDSELNPPKLIKQDVYGNVIDKLVLSEGWRKEKEYAAKCGIVAMAYETKHGIWNRLLQLLRLYYQIIYQLLFISQLKIIIKTKYFCRINENIKTLMQNSSKIIR